MSKDIRRRMSKLHEEHVAELLHARVSPGSGNQWNKPADGRMDSNVDEFAFAWDCKATRAASASVSLETWNKIKRQANSERPMVPIRFYLTDRLDQFVDLAVISLDDAVEMIHRGNGA